MTPGRRSLTFVGALGLLIVLGCLVPADDAPRGLWLAFLCIDAGAGLACLLRPRNALWILSTLLLVATSVGFLVDPLSPPWWQTFGAALGIGFYSEAAHLMVRLRSWRTRSEDEGQLVTPLLASIAGWLAAALGASVVLVASWALAWNIWVPAVMNASLERWAGWALSLAIGVACLTFWLVWTPWGRRTPDAARLALKPEGGSPSTNPETPIPAPNSSATKPFPLAEDATAATN